MSLYAQRSGPWERPLFAGTTGKEGTKLAGFAASVALHSVALSLIFRIGNRVKPSSVMDKGEGCSLCQSGNVSRLGRSLQTSIMEA
jgi:hypothetical protein